MSLDFRRIQFGLSDAQSEGKKYPRLLTQGYFDSSGIVERALDGDTFLFLGYKGSGKSALAEHLILSNQDNSEVFIDNIMMKSFPYKLFSRIVKGEAEHEAKYPLAWRWILCLYALHSLDRDSSLNRHSPDEWAQTVDVLRHNQIFPISTIADIVTKSSKRTFKIDLKIAQYTSEQSETGIGPEAYIEPIKTLLTRMDTPNRHYIIIDGLDDFLSDREQQNNSVTALINEAKDLNDWFASNGIPFKVIILCRTDVFDRLSDPNKNKIRQDYSFFIKWFDESEADDYKKSNLIELANLRGRLTYEDVDDIFDVFFPAEYDGQPIRNALLEFTRHTPRDFLQLLKYIQLCCEGEKVSGRNIAKGINRYSLEYFQNEIRDEMAGYLKPVEIDLTFQIFSQLRKPKFKLAEIKRIVENIPAAKDLNLNKIFSVLFDCSAIGHLMGKDEKHYIKYRNPSMTFSTSDTIIMHKGLWKALVI